MYFVLGMLIRIDCWGWCGFLLFLYYIWLEEFEGGRVRNGFDDFNFIREFNSS